LTFTCVTRDKERDIERFQFSLADGQVIDSINGPLTESGERQTQKKYQREALWLYEEAWNSPDTKKLPDSHREASLQSLLKYSDMLHEDDPSKKSTKSRRLNSMKNCGKITRQR